MKYFTGISKSSRGVERGGGGSIGSGSGPPLMSQKGPELTGPLPLLYFDKRKS